MVPPCKVEDSPMNLYQSYEALIGAGKIKPDPAQKTVIEKLARLAEQLNKKPGLLSRLFRQGSPQQRGLYIWGDVGRGKTMLMDLFFASVESLPKRRVHFHAFMQDVHAKRSTKKSDDVIADIADDIAKHAKLLCLDEMQISDIADAMIIGRLFEALQQRGVCFVTTSNLPPNQLYPDGLNRQLFLPFIAKLNSALDIVTLRAGQDYRLGRIATRQTYITPLSTKADDEMDAIWNELTDHTQGEPIDLEILGRKLHVPHAAHGCARFTFFELCEQPLAAPDYLAIARNFRNVFIDHIPTLKAAQRNEAKRFILMIDTFYDTGIRLVVTAAAVPNKLYPAGQHRAEFLRTVSRLQEMQSASWWKSLEAPSQRG
jgi:cell division protein ZapE